MNNALDQLKSAARKSAKTRRKAAAHQSPHAAGEIIPHLLDYLDGNVPQSLAGYLPIGSELDPQPILNHFRKLGTETALPVVVAEAHPLLFRQYQPGDSLVAEAFATRAPVATARQVMPDLVLVPLLAFDTKGYRLGYGGGFYDRTIAQFQQQNPNSVFIGLAYAAQQVDEVPIGAYDLPLKAIVTEKGVVRT